MIETECFQELNVFYQNGLLVTDLRPDGGNLPQKNNGKSPGFFSKIFRRTVSFFYLKLQIFIFSPSDVDGF